MTLFKNEFPILEFDDSPRAVIMPNHEDLDIKLPEKCVYAFLGEEINDYALRNRAKKIAEFESATKVYPVYVLNYKGHDICLTQAPVGAAAAGQFLDWLIAYGVREIISVGTCGSLVDIEESVFLIPTKALRDEGTSYHYMKPSRFVDVNQKAIDAIKSLFEEMGINYIETTTWTTDGFYRESKELVKYRIEEGCRVVEMECSALSAVAKLRKAIWGEILFTADTLHDVENYDQRNWARDTFSYALELAIDAVLEIKN